MGNSLTLHSACESSDLIGFKNLLAECTEVELEQKDDTGRTPLLVAAGAMAREEEEAYFDDEDDEDSNEHVIEPEESTELNKNTDNSSKGGEILQLLIQKGAKLDHKDEKGWTALHHACHAQSPVGITMLLKAGAIPMRDSYGLLPQDLLIRNQLTDTPTQADDLKASLDQLTEKSDYAIKLLAFRPSGIVQLDMGGQVEHRSFITIEYNVPENHSTKDYIQLLISKENSTDVEVGSYRHVPAGSNGQITLNTQEAPSSSTLRVVYVKTNINGLSRQVVASGCNVVCSPSVGEIFQYELYLYERVVEIESIPEFEFIDQPIIVLKRIGIQLNDEEIDWVDVRPHNHIVAVNDIRIDTLDFNEAVRVLQENNGKRCTKLLMQNYSAFGDFIPEKILGLGVIGKYAFLIPVDGMKEEKIEINQKSLKDWVTSDNSAENATISTENNETESNPAANSCAPSPTNAAAMEEEMKKISLRDVETVPTNKQEEEEEEEIKRQRHSTIETFMTLPNGEQLVEQLQQGIFHSSSIKRSSFLF